MHKIHWGPLLIAGAAGIALSAMPSNSHASDSQTAFSQINEATALGGGELIHSIAVVCVVIVAVVASRINTKKRPR